ATVLLLAHNRSGVNAATRRGHSTLEMRNGCTADSAHFEGAGHGGLCTAHSIGSAMAHLWPLHFFSASLFMA
ncbi:hypothetical protein NDU88_001628, partial [Pleurodeles waltl]